MATLANFPPELLLRIFSHLCYRDLVSARRTCVQWRDLSMDDGLLRTIKQRDFSQEQWEEKAYHNHTAPLMRWMRMKRMRDEEIYFPSDEEIGPAVFLGIKLKFIE